MEWGMGEDGREVREGVVLLASRWAVAHLANLDLIRR
jgi:hypothetical protein